MYKIITYLYTGFATPVLYHRTRIGGSFWWGDVRLHGSSVEVPATAVIIASGTERKNKWLDKRKGWYCTDTNSTFLLLFCHNVSLKLQNFIQLQLSLFSSRFSYHIQKIDVLALFLISY